MSDAAKIKVTYDSIKGMNWDCDFVWVDMSILFEHAEGANPSIGLSVDIPKDMSMTIEQIHAQAKAKGLNMLKEAVRQLEAADSLTKD